jgi:hypothetical protein
MGPWGLLQRMRVARAHEFPRERPMPKGSAAGVLEAVIEAGLFLPLRSFENCPRA